MTDMQVPYCDEHEIHKFENSAQQWRCPVCVMEEYVLDISQAEEGDSETYYCTATLDSGGRCGREVDEADTTCWQHSEDND